MDTIRYATIQLHIDKELTYAWDLERVIEELGLGVRVQESLWVMAYDSVAQVRTIVEVARGGYHEMQITLPAIMAVPLLAGTDRFSIMHNHPSDDVSPTALDVELTQKVRNAANVVGLFFEDHIIIGPSGETYSFVENRLIRLPKKVTDMADEHRPVARKAKAG